jgi:hypothetical protein
LKGKSKMKKQFLGALALATVLTACSGGGDTGGNKAGADKGGGTTVKAPAGTEWTATVAQTADGGYLIWRAFLPGLCEIFGGLC